jgi:hypothetical protein
MSYLKEQRAQGTLVSQIDTGNQTLALLPTPPTGLKVQLEEVKLANQVAVQSVSEGDIDSTKVINDILKSADQYNLTANPVTTDQWAKKSIGDSTYQILPIVLTITGKLSDLILFIGYLENRELFPYLAIEDLTVTNESSTAPAEAAPGTASNISVKLTISIITRLKANS